MVAFEKAPPEARQVLPVKIRELGLSVESSPVAGCVRQLYAELEAKGFRHFRPLCYLSDEWGSPSGQPIIGIPFYLGDSRVANLENALNDVENEREILMYLRHEAGHALNHAYELYRTTEWHDLFGSSRRPYRDDYPFVPFSRDFVRHIAGWYAQKHPDEDFAETFAVWLDPKSRWRQRYAGWGAMTKLLYVDRIAAQLAGEPPIHSAGETDITVDEMEQTVEEFYRDVHVDESPFVADLALDSDLSDIFVPRDHTYGTPVEPAAALLSAHRRDIIDKVHYWTGVRRTLVRTLVLAVERRLSELDLVTTEERSRQAMVEMTVYITTLANDIPDGQSQAAPSEDHFMNVVILFNTFEGYEEYPGANIEAAAAAVSNGRPRKKKKTDMEAISDALRELGHEPSTMAIDGRPQTLTKLSRSTADLYFNLVESYGGDDTKEFHFAAYLDLIGKKYTGAGPHGSFLAMDKSVAKKIVRYHDLHTPFSALLNKGRVEHAQDIHFPVIVKPAAEDASKGIDASSVVHSLKELLERIEYVHEEFDSPALLEEYIEGREIYAAVLGNDRPEALPLIELDLSRLPDGMPKIAGYEVKFDITTEAYRKTKSAPAELDEELTRKVHETAITAFRILKLRDYARIDMRIDVEGKVYVIEANPNPWLDPAAEFAMAAKQSGRSYTQLIGEIVELAMARY